MEYEFAESKLKNAKTFPFLKKNRTGEKKILDGIANPVQHRVIRKIMPRRDKIHYIVKQAFINDGWNVTDDPYVIS